MRSHRYTSVVLTVVVLSQVFAQQPKNIVYRAEPRLSIGKDASLENAILKENLTWTFGGKGQRGWQLYEPLIAQFVRCEGSADSEAFATSLSRWQESVNLAATGILDQETWMKMVEVWQTCRSKERTIPVAEKLVTVSAAEFYDPERPAELRQVERETYAAYKRMVAAASKDLGLATEANGMFAASEPYLIIISAFRSPEYQQKLRAQSPHSGRAGLAVNSPHFTGRTLDLYVGGEPVSTKDANRALQTNTKAYRWLVKNASKFGFIPYFYEPWHWEYNPSAAQQ